MLISIITTVRNGEQFLKETLQSVQNQIYKNYEHILVDDGSTDKTLQVISSFKTSFADNKIRLINTGGIGRARALNLGIAHAKGDWIAIIDADDLWHPWKLAYQIPLLSGSGIDVLGTRSNLFSKSEDIKYADYNNIKLETINTGLLLRSNQLSHSSVLIKKELCCYDENRTSQIDFELWLRLLELNKKLAIANATLTFHRIHKDQSFEGKIGRRYQWNAFKLTFHYSRKTRDGVALLYNFTRLVFNCSIPRRYRMWIIKEFSREKPSR